MKFFAGYFKWFIALFILLVIYGTALYRWTQKDTRALAWDQAIHTGNALEYQNRWKNNEGISLLRPGYFNYPPLYHFSLIPAIHRVKDIADAGAVVNFFYVCLLVFSVFFIGSFLFEKWQGFLAAFITLCYPNIATHATQTLIDVSLTAWVAFTILCLLKSEKFSRPVWSIGFGFSLGMAMLTKWTALAYILGPLMITTVHVFRGDLKKWWWLSLMIATALMIPWYAINFLPMLTRIPHLTSLPPASGFVLPGIANVFWYPLSLFEQIYLPFVLLLLPGLLPFLWKKEARLIAAWFFVSLLLFSLISNKNIRYFMPALPAAALLSVAWIPRLQKIPFIFLGFFCSFFFLLFHFSSDQMFAMNINNASIPIWSSHPAFSEDWKHNEIIEKINAFPFEKNKMARVLTISNAPHLHSTTLNISLQKKEIRNFVFRGPSKRRFFEFADFILLKTGELGPEFTIKTIKECAQIIQNPPGWFSQVFKEKARWSLPDNSELILYKKEIEPMPGNSLEVLNVSLGELDLPHIKASGVTLKALPLSRADTSVGKLKELKINCEKVNYKGVEFENVSVQLFRPQINLPLFLETQEIQMLSLDKLRPSATVSGETLLRYAAQKVKWLKNPNIQFEGSKIKIQGKAGFLPIEFSLDVLAEKNLIQTQLRSLRLGGISIPLILARAVTDRSFSLLANDEMPYDLEINSIIGDDGVLKLN